MTLKESVKNIENEKNYEFEEGNSIDFLVTDTYLAS
jgi:hypothetical protein